MKLIFILSFISFSFILFGNECEQLTITAGAYTETEDLNQKIKDEFGDDYSIADWTDLEAISDLDAWITCMELTSGQQMMVTRNGNYFYGTNRQYFFGYYPGGSPPVGFLAHASIGNKLFLGSWYGITMHVLAINSGVTNPEVCEDYKITANSYLETENLNQKIKDEYGDDFAIADWTDLEAISDLGAWITCMSLVNGQQLMVTRNGNYFYGTNRQYFFGYYPGGSPPLGFLAHASIGNKLFLGSWYGISMHILAKKTASTNLNNIMEPGFLFYPNPAHNTLYIVQNYANLQGNILSLNGSLKLSFINKTVIDLSGLEKGVYLFELKSDKINMVSKLVIN